MLYIGQIMKNKTTKEIGFFEGFDLGPKPLRVITKSGFADYDDFEIIKDKNNNPIPGNFVSDNKIHDFFGKLNEKAVKEIRKNWKRYSDIEESK